MKPYPRSLWIGSVAALAVCYLAFAESPAKDRPLQSLGPAALPTLEEAQLGDAPFVQPQLNRNTEVRIRTDVNQLDVNQDGTQNGNQNGNQKDVNQQPIQAGDNKVSKVGLQDLTAVQQQNASRQATPLSSIRDPKAVVDTIGSVTHDARSTVHGARALGVQHAHIQQLPARPATAKVHPVVHHSISSSKPVTYRPSHGLVLRPEAVAAFETVQKESDSSADLEPLGHFTVTAYALTVQSTGKSPGMPGFGITASGSHAHVGRTVAVDPTVIPIGSLIFIDLPGVGWRLAEDTGGAIKGHHIDLLLPSDSKALKFGIKHGVKVYTMSR
ncbi:3D domain-containing protein [Alicyclobacillus ferrooxydans]|uniref:3D domain-containing protein n=1 Tax=Alicyclobacillus ferrooxydans TaxID=471514 RepID=UPI001FDEBEE4|nr:3D domain-containing protein [Alicyclobacillus ferrooxydans]